MLSAWHQSYGYEHSESWVGKSHSHSPAPRAGMLLLNYWFPRLFTSSHREDSHSLETPYSLNEVQFGFNV